MRWGSSPEIFRRYCKVCLFVRLLRSFNRFKSFLGDRDLGRGTPSFTLAQDVLAISHLDPRGTVGYYWFNS